MKRAIMSILCAAVFLNTSTEAQAQLSDLRESPAPEHTVSVALVVPFGTSGRASRDARYAPRLQLQQGWTEPVGTHGPDWELNAHAEHRTMAPLAISLDGSMTAFAFDEPITWDGVVDPVSLELCEADDAACLNRTQKWVARGALVAGVLVLTGLTLVALGDGSY